MAAKYMDIAAILREQIKKGLIPLYAQLSERKLAEQFQIGRSTIASAFKVLKDEGYIESYAKSVTRVVKRPLCDATVWEKLVDRGMSATSTDENISTIKYLSNSGKIGLTFGLHKEFAPYEPFKKAMLSLPSMKNLDEHLNIFDDKGLPILRETLVEHLKVYDISCTPNNIIIFPGYLEAIHTISASLFSRGINIYCMQGDMMWGQRTLHTTGANMHEIPIDDKGPSSEKFEQMIKGGQNVLYVNPVNSFPSGLTFSETRMKEIMQTCCKHNIAVLENDFLRDIWIIPPPKPLKARNSETVIYVGTMANSYVTGMRLGWAVVPDFVVPRISEVKMQMTSGNSTGAELVVNEILSKGYYNEFLEKLREKLPERLEKVNKILLKYLSRWAKWNPESIIYTAFLELDERINVDLVIFENPYFLLPSSSQNGRRNCIFTNILGMSLGEFECMAYHCAKSIEKQMVQR